MKKYIAELIGTFALVFCGTCAIVVNAQNGGAITHIGIALTFGLTIMSMIYAIGNVSGAHLNPAVSIAFVVTGKFPVKEAIPYIISQLAGAFIASGLLRYLFADANDATSLGATLPSGSDMQSFILEIILTFFLMFVILNVANGTKEQGMFAGIAIGGVIVLDILFGGMVSGASMNPARSLGPAVVSGNMQSLWVYMAGPIAGAILAVPVYNMIKENNKQ